MMNAIYKFLLSIRDFISFLSGIIVSGYVVEISLNPGNIFFHWCTVVCGLLFGCLSFILIRISRNFDDNFTASKTNNLNNTKIQNEQNAWQGITNKELPLNKILGRFPQFWMPIITVLMPLSFVLGIAFLNFGNQENDQKNKIIIHESQTDLISKIDSIERKNISDFEVENAMDKDSLYTLSKTLEFQSKQIDSLENIIHSLKQNAQKEEQKKKKIE